jgi:hypothetical protein
MTLIEVLITSCEDPQGRRFQRKDKPVLCFGNGLEPDDRDYERTPNYRIEFCEGPHQGEGVDLTLESFNAVDWELVD